MREENTTDEYGDTHEYFYAVQVGDDEDWDYGDVDYDKAYEIAEREMEYPENDGLQIRLVTLCIHSFFNGGSETVCVDEEIIREGKRVEYGNESDYPEY